MPPAQRTINGLTSEQRRAERRARLDEAALEIIGTRGWAKATMTEICRAAGLTERYFYESYRSREDIYLSLIDRLASELRENLLAAVARAPDDLPSRIHAAAQSIVDLLICDPRKGRAALLEGTGAPQLEQRRREIITGLEDMLIVEHATIFGNIAADPHHRALSAAAIGGAATELVRRHLEGRLGISDSELVDCLANLGTLLTLAQTDRPQAREHRRAPRSDPKRTSLAARVVPDCG